MRLFSWIGKLFAKKEKPVGFIRTDEITKLLRKKFGGKWEFDPCNKRWRRVDGNDTVRRAPGSYRQFVFMSCSGAKTEFTL